MIGLAPDSLGARLREYNACHEPGGQPTGGRFCSDIQSKAAAVGEYHGDSYKTLQVHLAKEQAWKKRVERALTFGRLTFDQARELGYYASEFEADRQWGPLPETLYHVTTNASAVMAGRLKTRSELKQQRGLGLGGGTDEAVSLTTDRNTAVAIYDALLEMRAVASGDISARDLMTEASQGFQAKRQYDLDLLRLYGGDTHALDMKIEGWTSLSDGSPTSDALRKEYGATAGAFSRASIERHGLKVARNAQFWQGRDQEFTVDSMVYRRMTDEEQRNFRVNLYKTYLHARQEAGGPINPLFFVSDEEAIANIKASDVAIIKLKPRAGAHGWKMSGLSEWRTWHGAAVRPILADSPPHSFRRHLRESHS